MGLSKLFTEALIKKECNSKETIQNFISRCKEEPKVTLWDLNTLKDLYETSTFDEQVTPVQFSSMINACKKDFLENGETNPQN